MLPPRACKWLDTLNSSLRELNSLSADFFLGLNAVRVLSIIALLLVFSSSIFVLVNDIRAVNRSMASPSSDMSDCDYIECVLLSIAHFQRHAHEAPSTEAAPSPTSPRASSGRS